MQLIASGERLQDHIAKNKLDTILPVEVIKACELCVYKKDESILTAKTSMHYYYFFCTGKLKIFQFHENGRAFLIQFYTAFDALGEIELMTDMDATCSVTAIQESELIRIPMDIMKRYATEYPAFLKYVIRALSMKLLIADSHHASNLLNPVLNRLASYLKAHNNDQQSFVLSESLQEISDYIGTTYRQLHRAFSRLEEEGIIIRDNKKILVCNQEQLSNYAGNIYRI